MRGRPTGSAIRRLGYLGRVSLNPIVHADLLGTIIFPLIGIFCGGFMFGWAKPVPVNVSELRNPETRSHAGRGGRPAQQSLMALGLFICLMMHEGTFFRGWGLIRCVRCLGFRGRQFHSGAHWHCSPTRAFVINVMLASSTLFRSRRWMEPPYLRASCRACSSGRLSRCRVMVS